MRGTTLVHTQSILSPVSPPVLGMHKRPKIILFYTLRPNEVRIFKRPLYLSRTMGLTGLSWTELGVRVVFTRSGGKNLDRNFLV